MHQLSVLGEVSVRLTHKNLIYDLAHHESPIAQWLIKHPAGIWKVMGSTPAGGSENSFSEFSVENASSLFLYVTCLKTQRRPVTNNSCPSQRRVRLTEVPAGRELTVVQDTYDGYREQTITILALSRSS